MRRVLLFGLSGLGVCLGWVLGCSQAPPPASVPEVPDVVVERDRVFARPGGVPLRADVAKPVVWIPGHVGWVQDGPSPAVVCLHGGGWVRGDRRQMSATLSALARRGYVAMAPEYRLAPKARFPAQLEDCQAAVRWLREQAKAYGVDPERIGVMGLAAGGHLACLVGVTGKDEARVQAVVSFFGPTDFTTPFWDREVLEKNLVPFLGGTPAEVPDAYRRASPLSYPVEGAPPFLFLHGSADKVVPPSQSQALAEKLKKAGVAAEVELVEGQGHGWHGPALVRSIARTIVFFDLALRGPQRR